MNTDEYEASESQVACKKLYSCSCAREADHEGRFK